MDTEWLQIKGLNGRGHRQVILAILPPQNSFQNQLTKSAGVFSTSGPHHRNNVSASTYLHLLDVLGQNLSHIFPESTELLLFDFILWSDSS